MNRADAISFCFPAFDEEDNVDACVAAVRGAVQELGLARFEILFVDDGSRDATARKVEAHASADPRIRLVRHARNLGYGAALRSAIGAATMPWIFLTDADLQFDLADLGSLVARSGEADFVQGYRVERLDPLGRVVLGAVYRGLVRSRFDVHVRDPECSFRLVRTELARSLRIVSRGPFVPVELLFRAGASGARFAEVGVPHRARLRGVSKALTWRSVTALAVDVLRVEVGRSFTP